MSAMSDYLEDKLRGYIFRGSAFTQPTHLYVGLWTSTLTDASTGATAGEVSTSGTAYARFDAVCGTTWSTEGGGTGKTDNTVEFVFPTATASWGTVTDVAILDSASVGAGNILLFGLLATSKTVGLGDTFKFGVSGLTISFA